MVESERIPQYSNDGVAVWVKQTKNGDPYLTIKIVGHSHINAWVVKPDKKQKHKK